MKFKKLDLLTLLIGLFLFASCKDESNIGLDLDSNTAIEGKLVDTLTINTKTLLEPATETSGVNRHPLGYLNDPVFGKTESSLALSIALPNDAFTFGTTPTLDSAVLVLSYGGEFYGDTTTSLYQIEVKQLNNNLSANEAFLSNKVYPASGSILGSQYDVLYPTKPLKITDVVKGRPDTVKSVPAQIRIKLNTAFMQNNVVNLSAAALRNDAAFAASFKGLKVEVNRAASLGPLGMMFFDFSNPNSNLELYYKRQGATATTVDTVLSVFPITTSRSPIAATITHDYSGTAVETQTSNPNTKYAVTYLSGLAGVRNQISFPSMKRFAASVGKVVINKAELVIDLSSGTDVAPFLAAKRISLYRSDIAGQHVNISDRQIYQSQYQNADSGDLLFGGFFDSTKNRYIFSVTDFVQSMVDGKVDDYGTYLSVTPSPEFIYLKPTITSAARSIIGSGAKDAAGNLINPNNKIKLNIYYTKVN